MDATVLQLIRVIDVHDLLSIFEHFHILTQPFFVSIMNRTRFGIVLFSHLVSMPPVNVHIVNDFNALGTLKLTIGGTKIATLTLPSFIAFRELIPPFNAATFFLI